MSYAAISYVRIRLLVCEREHATRRFHSLVWLSNGGFFMLNGTKSVGAKQGEAGPPPAILLGSSHRRSLRRLDAFHAPDLLAHRAEQWTRFSALNDALFSKGEHRVDPKGEST